jgi:hypothetical protein
MGQHSTGGGVSAFPPAADGRTDLQLRSRLPAYVFSTVKGSWPEVRPRALCPWGNHWQLHPRDFRTATTGPAPVGRSLATTDGRKCDHGPCARGAIIGSYPREFRTATTGPVPVGRSLATTETEWSTPSNAFNHRSTGTGGLLKNPDRARGIAIGIEKERFRYRYRFR